MFGFIDSGTTRRLRLDDALALIVVLLALAAAALWQGTDVFVAGLRTAMGQLVRFLPVLVVAMLMAGFAEVLFPKQLVESWLSDNAGWRGIGLAWLAGILTPGGAASWACRWSRLSLRPALVSVFW